MKKNFHKISALLLLLILIFSASSVFGQNAGKIQEYKLDNGIKVLIQEVHSAPVVSVFVWYRVGSRNENVGITGISHQLEHMLFKGTKTFKPGEIDRLLNRAGAENNAFTAEDFTAYFETLPSSNLELALKIEADRMVNSLIDPKELKHEKTVVLSELEGDENNPWFDLYEEVAAAAFKAHPYHWPVIGWKCDVLNYTREDVYKYYKEFYKPENATLVIVGDISAQEALMLAKKYFGKIPSGGPVPQIMCQEPAQQGERRVIVKKEGATTLLHVAYHIPAVKDPDIFPLSIMDSVLTGGRSSRLYKALVETELAAEVGSWVDRHIDPTLFYITVVLRPGVSTEKVEEVLYAELEKLKKEPISDLELKKAVNQVNSSFIYARDSVTSQAETLGYYETIYTYKYIDTFADNLKKVTKEDVMKVAGKYLTPDNRTVGIFIPLPPKSPESMSAPMQAPGPARYKEDNSLVSANEKSKKTGTGGKKHPVKKKPAVSTPAKKASKPPVSKVKIEQPVRVVLDNGIILLKCHASWIILIHLHCCYEFSPYLFNFILRENRVLKLISKNGNNFFKILGKHQSAKSRALP
ncbi:MAG: insulinase family protein [Firmicutes bacterium]|nr:insulinase family protein [Bacillota bacterium]